MSTYQKQTDEQPPDATIAIEKRVDRLELSVRQPRLEDGRRRPELVVKEPLEVVESHRHLVGWRRHEASIRQASPTDPVLRTPKLARRSGAAAAVLEQDAMHLAQEAKTQRKAARANPVEAVLEGSDVARDLPHVCDRSSRRDGILVLQELDQAGLRALNLAR